MRYSEYVKQLTRLETAIAAERAAEAKAVAGEGNWLDRMMPSRFQAKIEKASSNRTALLQQRARLIQSFFGGTALFRNVDMNAAMGRTLGSDTFANLWDAARAVADGQQTAGDGK